MSVSSELSSPSTSSTACAEAPCDFEASTPDHDAQRALRAAKPPMIDRSLEDRIRREYFARASHIATRYGVTLDEVLWHLRCALLPTTPGPARVLNYVDDVALAVACSRGHPRAWHDAWERHESALIRACHARLNHADAVLFTRRFWVDLFVASTTTELTAAPSDDFPLLPWPIRHFVGVRPLRVWLSDRLLARLEHEVAAGRLEASARARASGTVPQRLTADGSGQVRPPEPANAEGADGRRPRESRLPREPRLRLVEG